MSKSTPSRSTITPGLRYVRHGIAAFRVREYSDGSTDADAFSTSETPPSRFSHATTRVRHFCTRDFSPHPRFFRPPLSLSLSLSLAWRTVPHFCIMYNPSGRLYEIIAFREPAGRTRASERANGCHVTVYFFSRPPPPPLPPPPLSYPAYPRPSASIRRSSFLVEKGKKGGNREDSR
jgi:hypothetical protein